MKAALQSGEIPQRRLDDMVERILWALFAKGAVDDPVRVGADRLCGARRRFAEGGGRIARAPEERWRPTPVRGVKSIAVIGGNADKGVLAGAGSSDVTPVGGAVMIDNHTFCPRRRSRAQARAAAGPGSASTPAPIRRPLRRSRQTADVAIVFVTQHNSEG